MVAATTFAGQLSQKYEAALPGVTGLAFTYFVEEKGLTPAQAAGIIGNLRQESGLDSAALQAGGEGHGLAQWGGSRLLELEAFAKKKGVPWTDANAQLEFIWWELTEKPRFAPVLAALGSAQTPQAAARVFEEGYEVAGKPDMANREAYAAAALAQYNG